MKNIIAKSTLALALSFGIATTSIIPSFAAEPVISQDAKRVQVVRKPTISSGSLLYKELKNGMFDYEYYKANNPDVVMVLGDSYDAMLRHFITYGMFEGRQPNVDFNINAYASAYADLRGAFEGKGNDYQVIANYYNHYAKYGKNENRDITSIEKAQEAGITVTKIGTDEVIAEVEKPSNETVWSFYSEKMTELVEVEPSADRKYQSVYDSSLLTMLNNVIDFMSASLLDFVDEYPELKSDAGVSNCYRNYLTSEQYNLADISIEYFLTVHNYLNNELIDSIITDPERAAGAKEALAYCYKAFDELNSHAADDFDEIVEYRAYISGLADSVSNYTYAGQSFESVKYYATAEEAEAAYQADLLVDETVTQSGYGVAQYADFASAKADFMNSIPQDVQYGLCAYWHQLGVTPMTVYCKMINDWDNPTVDFGEYFDSCMSDTF